MLLPPALTGQPRQLPPPHLGQAACGTPSLGADPEALHSPPPARRVLVQEGEILCTLKGLLVLLSSS